MFQRKLTSALLIDFDNIVGSLGKPFIEQIPRWMAWLEDGKFDKGERKRVFEQKRVYWNTQFAMHAQIFQQNGFEVIPCPSRVRRNKSAADMIIALDAFQSSQEHKRIKEYVVLTIDTDFIPLLDRLAEKGKATVAVANLDTHKVVADHADIVIPIAALADAIRYERRKRSLFDVFRRRRPPVEPAGPTPPAETGPAAIGRAAAEIAAMATRTPGMPIGKEAVVRALPKVLPAFTTTGRARYIGHSNYAQLIEKIAAMRPDLKIVRYRNGGVAIMAPPKDEPPAKDEPPRNGDAPRKDDDA
jgi:uncharacterized LabA/DUF88 family protein